MTEVGPVVINGTAALSPMAGVTDLPFRLLCAEKGSAFSVTEMVSAKGFICAPQNRATEELLARDPNEGLVALQLFGHEPDVMAEAARRLEERHFPWIDLNMGCPAPKITGGGEGSALMRDLPLAREIIEQVVRAVRVPVTVKMRLGWDDASRCEVAFARMAEEAGASMLAVHGRTRVQFYAGQADWGAIANVKAAVRIPVFGNGDVFCAEDARRMMTETGCNGVLIGRGAQGNPWIFQQILDMEAGRTQQMPSADDRVQMALRHTRMLTARKGEEVAIREMRKHVAWYLHGLHGAARLRTRVNTMVGYAEMTDILETYAHTLDETGMGKGDRG